MFSRADAKVIILIMLMAIILAVTAALAYFYILNRPEYPEGTYTVIVEGEEILIDSDPELSVRLLQTPEIQQPALPEVTVDNGQGGGDGSGATLIPPTVPPPVVTPLPVTPIPVTPIPPTPIPPTPIPPTPLPPVPQVIIENYQVVQGDTLYGITTKRNTTIALMARYGIDATDLVPGTFIPLPVANPAYCPGNFPYVVQEDDTLSSIAIKCETTVAILKQINGFGDNYRLDVTDVICVPNPP